MIHLAFALTGMLLTCFLGALAGKNVGRTRERDRCLSITAQSWQRETALSPTARRIYNSIASGRPDLITEDEFFGKKAS